METAEERDLELDLKILMVSPVEHGRDSFNPPGTNTKGKPQLINVTRHRVPRAAKKAERPRLCGTSRPYINSNRRSNQALAADAA